MSGWGSDGVFEVRCTDCNGYGMWMGEECSSCDGLGFKLTELGKQAMLMIHRRMVKSVNK